MGVYLNPGNEGFRKAVSSKIYVDKTMLIHHTNECLCTEQEYICISRPRRFGKSVAANMLAAYYSRGAESDDIFKKYKIQSSSTYREHLNKYNVIFLNMQEFFGSSESVTQMLELIMNYDGLKDNVTKLLAGERVKMDIGSFSNDMTTFHSADDVLTLLVHLGYLAYDSDAKSVLIPNSEVAGVFATVVCAAGWNVAAGAIGQSEQLLQAIWDRNEKKVAAGINNIYNRNHAV